QVDGHAVLGGTYNFTLINKPNTSTQYVPQLNDEITFLKAPNFPIAGVPVSLFAPNLKSVLQAANQPELGFVVIKNNNDVRLRFVTPTDVHFVDNTSNTPQDRNQMGKWSNTATGIPDPSSKVDLTRTQAPNVSRIEVKSVPAQAYDLNVHDQSSPITLAIENNQQLSAATGDITIGQ